MMYKLERTLLEEICKLLNLKPITSLYTLEFQAKFKIKALKEKSVKIRAESAIKKLQFSNERNPQSL